MRDMKESLPVRQGASQGLSASRKIYNTGMRTLIYIAAAVVGNVTTRDGTRTRAIARRRPYGRTTRLAPVRRCAITYMLVTSPTPSVSAMP